MARSEVDNINIFAPQEDLLDMGVKAYEENVPLIGQIAAGFTPPGMGIDLLSAGKYGRDAFRNFTSGQGKEGAINLGIAGLSALGAIPLIGDLARGPKSYLRQALTPKTPNPLEKAISKEGADEVININKINKITDPETGTVIKSPPARVEDATAQMKSTSAGYEYKGVKQEPRQPIEVLVQPDGSLQQLAGKSSMEALESAGVSSVPIKKFASQEEFLAYDKSRKLNKEIKRVKNSVKLQPKAGSRTLEQSLEPFGSKTEKQVKQIFNGHQADITTGSVDEDALFLFERAKRLNPQFQKSMDDIAVEMNKKTTTNPGGEPGAINMETGSLDGQVKLVPRMVEKASDKYAGDVSQMTDAIRTRIIVNTPAEEVELAKKIADKFPTIDSGRVLKPEGYIDRKLNIQFTGTNGEKIIAEVGLITDEMWKASDKAHKIYDDFRTLFPKGMPTDPALLAKYTDDVIREGRKMQGQMNELFGPAGKKIDQGFFDLDISKFAMGGAVSYATGRSGKVPPMVPNFSLKEDSDNSVPSTKKSATCAGLAGIHESSLIKNPRLPSGTGSMTAGAFSQAKYKRDFSIEPILQKSAQNYNLDDIDIFNPKVQT
jgi:hypothetical protein